MKLTDLPALGQELQGGIFAGITTRQDGAHCAVILLPERGGDLSWDKAIEWAKELDAELPTRSVAALLFANVKDKLRPRWYWTSEVYDASFAWGCGFGSGYQTLGHKSYEGSAVAVRSIPLTA